MHREKAGVGILGGEHARCIALTAHAELGEGRLLNRIELLASLPNTDRERILHTFDVLYKDAPTSRVAA